MILAAVFLLHHPVSQKWTLQEPRTVIFKPRVPSKAFANASVCPQLNPDFALPFTLTKDRDWETQGRKKNGLEKLFMFHNSYYLIMISKAIDI